MITKALLFLFTFSPFYLFPSSFIAAGSEERLGLPLSRSFEPAARLTHRCSPTKQGHADELVKFQRAARRRSLLFYSPKIMLMSFVAGAMNSARLTVRVGSKRGPGNAWN